MNIIDTRDLYKRQCELQSELETLQDAVSDAQEALNDCEDVDEQETLAEALDNAVSDLDIWQSEYQEELDDLNALESEVGREWMHGETLIDEDDFVEYTEQFADDIGAIDSNNAFWIVIDWEATADGLKMDYSSCEYQGTTYLSAEEYNPEGWPLDGDEANTEDDLEAFFQALVGMSDGRVPWVSFELAYTCSKMRPEAFGGAAVFITADDVKHISTAGWLMDQVAAMNA